MKILAKRSSSLLLATLLLLSSFMALFALPTIDASAAAARTGLLRVAHLAPAAPNVDVYLDKKLTLSNVPFGTVSKYLSVPEATYEVEVFVAGANPRTADPVIAESIDVEAGSAFTYSVLNFDENTDSYFYEDSGRSAPATGNAKIKVLHASPDAGAVDVAVQGGPVLFGGLNNGESTDYLEVPTGSYKLELREAGTSNVLYTIPTINLAAGTLYTAIAQGFVGGSPAFKVQLVTDAQFSRVRVAHLSPGTPEVDVYVGNKRVLANVPFGAFSNYLELESGTYQVRVFLSSAKGKGTPAINANITVAVGKEYTVAALGKTANITAQVYTDDNSKPAAGKTRIRVIHAGADAPAVDVAIQGGAVLVPNLSFKQASGYLEVPAGSYKLEVRVAGTNTVAYTIPTLNLQAGIVYSAVAEGLLSGTPAFKVDLITDKKY